VAVQIYSSQKKNHIINDSPGRRVHICYCVFLKRGERERKRQTSDLLARHKSLKNKAHPPLCSWGLLFHNNIFLMGNRTIPTTGLRWPVFTYLAPRGKTTKTAEIWKKSHLPS